MNEFAGFPSGMMFTPIPNLVFSSLLPQITDLDELKLLLHSFEIIYPKKGSLKFASLGEILQHASVLGDLPGLSREMAMKSLEALTDKHILLHLKLQEGEAQQDVYFLNSEPNRTAIDKIQKGELKLPGLTTLQPSLSSPVQAPDVFSLYEQNIGLLTPMIADELREAEKDYPADWIRDAIKEAVAANRRNWRYISRILERWAVEGKGYGTHRGNLKENTDPDKYIRGKYGHMVQR